MLNKTINKIEQVHKIELFSAGCKFCNSVENQVKEITGSNNILVTYNLHEEANAVEYYRAAERYNINAVPAVVVDGKLLSCCGSSGFNKEILSAALT